MPPEVPVPEDPLLAPLWPGVRSSFVPVLPGAPVLEPPGLAVPPEGPTPLLVSPGLVAPELVSACANRHPLSGARAEARACLSTDICGAHAGAWLAMAIAIINIMSVSP